MVGEASLLFLVGLTGAGKSTVLTSLLDHGDLRPLPDRRHLTDLVMIPEALRLEGREPSRVSDRLERFRLTARYRSRHPEGIVHALARSLAEQEQSGAALFDGLRGEEEVRAADRRWPDARFLMLEAAPVTRVERILARAEAFDGVSTPTPKASDGARLRAADGATTAGRGLSGAPAAEHRVARLRARLAAVDGAAAVFDTDELARRWQGRAEPDEQLLKAMQIVVEEQRHYRQSEARRYLEGLPAQRRLILDTDGLSPEQVAARARAWS